MADSDPGRWRMLALLGLAELLGMSRWFAGTAAIAVLNLADIVSSRILFSIAALTGALFNSALLMVDGFVPAVATTSSPRAFPRTLWERPS